MAAHGRGHFIILRPNSTRGRRHGDMARPKTRIALPDGAGTRSGGKMSWIGLSHPTRRGTVENRDQRCGTQPESDRRRASGVAALPLQALPRPGTVGGRDHPPVAAGTLPGGSDRPEFSGALDPVGVGAMGIRRPRSVQPRIPASLRGVAERPPALSSAVDRLTVHE